MSGANHWKCCKEAAALRAEVAALREATANAMNESHALRGDLATAREEYENLRQNWLRNERRMLDENNEARELLAEVLDSDWHNGERGTWFYVREGWHTRAAEFARLDLRRDEARRSRAHVGCGGECDESARDEARGAPDPAVVHHEGDVWVEAPCPCLQWEPEVRGSRSFHVPGCEYAPARAAPPELDYTGEPLPPGVHRDEPWCEDCESDHEQCPPTRYKVIEGHPLSKVIKTPGEKVIEALKEAVERPKNCDCKDWALSGGKAHWDRCSYILNQIAENPW